jgi:hypothetical protein
LTAFKDALIASEDVSCHTLTASAGGIPDIVLVGITLVAFRYAFAISQHVSVHAVTLFGLCVEDQVFSC